MYFQMVMCLQVPIASLLVVLAKLQAAASQISKGGYVLVVVDWQVAVHPACRGAAGSPCEAEVAAVLAAKASAGAAAGAGAAAHAGAAAAMVALAL